MSGGALPRPAGRQARAQQLELLLVAAAVFFAPMNYFRAGIAYVTLGDLFAVAAFLLRLAAGRLPLRPLGPASGLWFASVFLLLLGLLLGSVVNGDALAGAEGTGQYFISLVLLPVILLQRPQKDIVLLIKVLLVSLAVTVIHGAYYVAFHPDDWRFVSPSGRLQSLIERENEAAALTALGIVLALGLCFSRRLRPAAAVPAVLLLGYGLLLTGSNTGFFLAAGGIVLLAALHGSARGLVAVAGFGLFAGAAVYGWGEQFLPAAFQTRVLEGLRSGDLQDAGTFSGRLLLLREAAGIANETIWAGLGVDQYRLASAHRAPVHNAYLLLLAEGGLLALTGLAGLLMSGVFLAWSAHVHHRGCGMPALTLTVVIMLALALSGFPHFYARFWLVPWLLALGLSLPPAARRRRPLDG